ncbi:hypothetical protein RP300_00533 [Oligella urethralis]|uniref:AAA family ATPase n=1 Tax=Oligella urethralis TaxID=90245 RepID=UPI0029588749|nr:AAA family ATPase [Oligella urethralis]WOS36996.1 hypothetical protein RP300_00533 [Oligella urethralis]
MKLLELRFKNLNSLEGEWLIDFSHAAYEQNGIFAIAGPTGAGKTTLLDAICLALYGRTPRLDSFSKSHNEIMSRQHAECFAELKFQIGQRTYSAAWSQRRARNRVDGNLQQIQRELFDVDSGKLLSSRIAEINQLTADITGLDFERFTRTMLLAQGRFADFLNAKEEERSPILEQITGTRIYSDISIKVHEIKTQEEKNLALLSAGLEGITPLSEDEVSALQASLQQLNHKLQQLNQQQQALRELIQWWEESAKTKQTEEELQRSLRENRAEAASFAPKAAMLALANKSLALIKDYTVLTGLRTTLKNNQDSLQQLAPKLSEATTKRNQTQEAYQRAQALHTQQAELLEQQTEHFKAVRTLDAEIKQQRLLLQNEERNLQQKQAHLKGTEKQLQLEQESYQNLQQSIRRAYQDSEAKGYALAQDPLSADSDELLDRLSHQREILNLKNRSEQLTQELRILETLSELFKNYHHQSAENHRTRQSLEALNESLLSLQTVATQHQQQLQVTEAQLAQAEAEHKLALVQQSLEQHRQDLVDGTPCPLCGALEHPWAEHDSANPAHTQQQLTQAKQAYKAAQEAVNHQQQQITQQAADIRALEQRLSDGLTAQQAHLDHLSAKASSLSDLNGDKQSWLHLTDINATADTLGLSEQALSSQKEQQQQQLKQLHTELSDREKMQHWAQEQRIELTQLKVSMSSLQSQLTNHQTSIASSEENLKGIQLTLDASKQSRYALFADHDPDAAEAQLKQKLAQLEQQLSLSRTAKDDAAIHFSQLNQRLQDLQHAVHTLSAELEAANDRFKTKLNNSAFVDEKAFVDACLDETERLNLEQEQRRINDRNHLLTEQLKQTTAKLAELAAQQPDAPKELALCKAEWEQVEAQKAELNSMRGRDNEKLRSHFNAVERLAEQKAQIEAQEVITQRWRLLHELIGSADGKKYRNFAQSLTFEFVLHYANQQLAQMSDRYSLCLDPEPGSKLELYVADHYQGGELRSIKNLSGGESFIVSLALALGLSQMVGGKMQLESLFLDEGFGTLDEDSLDIALSSLANLQRGGKTIGIISHVAALKERIATQIQVIPMSGGRSRLEGPGIRAL